MATFIAEHPIHVVVRSEIKALYDDRDRLIREHKPRLFAKFVRGVAPDWAVDVGLSRFEFRGIPDGVSKRSRLSWFDTEVARQQHGWSKEDHEDVVAKLRTRPGIVEIERPKLKAPWPAYDKLVVHGKRTIEHVAEKIVTTVTELELDPGDVIAYERENLNRKEVVEALQALSQTEEGDEEVEPLVAA